MIRRQRLWMGIGGALAVLAGLVVWHPHSVRQQPIVKRKFPEAVSIGMVAWPGYLPLIVAKQAGYFHEAGVEGILKRYASLGELSQDYVAGRLLGRANITLDAVNERLGGLEHQIVLVIDYSSGADMILAGPDVPTMRDIAGKRVAFEAGTLEEFFLDWALRKAGLTLADVKPIFADPERAAKLLIDKQVDVAVTYEPSASQAVAAGAHAICSSAEAPGLISDVLTFRSDFIEQYPETVSAITRAYFRGLEFWKQHPEEACGMVAKEYGQTEQEVVNQLRGVHLVDLPANQLAFTPTDQLQSLHGHLRELAGFLYRQGRDQSKMFNVDEMIQPHFIRALTEGRGQRSPSPGETPP